MKECKRCGNCCIKAVIHIQLNEANKDKAEWLRCHGCGVNIFKSVIAITIPHICVHLRFDMENNTYNCNTYDTRPEMCKNFICEYMRDSR